MGELNRFVYTAVYDQICDAACAELKEHGYDLVRLKHERQMRLRVRDGMVFYTFTADASYAPESLDNTVKLMITCGIRFTETGFSLVNVDTTLLTTSLEASIIPEHCGVPTDQHLLPKLAPMEAKEAEAERFLSEYCAEAIKTPMAVPIREIMEEQMGVELVTAMTLMDSNAYGFTVFEGQVIHVRDEMGEEHTPYYLPGTIIIDAEKAMIHGTGRMRDAMAHEAYHWFAHRPYEYFHKIVGKPGNQLGNEPPPKAV